MIRSFATTTLLALLGSAVAGCGASEPLATYDPMPRVEVVTAGAVPELVTRTVLGSAEPARDAFLTPMRPGRVVERVAPPGTTVERGDPILRLDAREARANAAAAAAAVEEAGAVLDQARSQARRIDALGDGASEAAGDEARTGVLRAEAGLARAQAQRDLARVNLDHMTLRAPFAGTVALLEPEVGESVGGAQPVARVVDQTHLVVVVGLLADEIAAAQAAGATFTAITGSTRTPATLQHVAPAADPRTLQWRTELRVEGAPVPPGSPLSVEVGLAPVGGQALVPSRALHDGVVWALEGDVVTSRPVTVLGEAPGGLLVDGVAAGTPLVGHHGEPLADGLTVRRLGTTPAGPTADATP